MQRYTKIFIILSFFTSCLLQAQNKDVVMLNSGKMYVAPLLGKTQTPSIRIVGSLTVDSLPEISLHGRAQLDGDFLCGNIQQNSHIFTQESAGVFEFKGTEPQYIMGQGNKENRFIAFPTINVNNQTTVTNPDADTCAVVVRANMALSVDTINLYQGRLILESDTINASQTQTAHLLVSGKVNYNLNNYTDAQKKGVIQVQLDAGNHYKSGRLLGFTPPFKHIYTDYFLCNFVSAPSNHSLFGNDNNLIVSPKVEMISGKGYIVGLGIVPEGDSYWVENWNPEWFDVDFSHRFTQKLTFARDFAPADFTKFVNTDPAITNAFSDEVINTQDITVELEQGWNYLGNPFTAPLDMTDFLNEESSAANDWAVSRGKGLPADVQNKYYVLSLGQGFYNSYSTQYPFSFAVSYLVAQKEGGTVTRELDAASNQIAPMQLFVIKKNTPGAGQMTIPASKRSLLGNVKYQRAMPTGNTRLNQVLIETLDTETEAFDRLCILFDESSASAAYEASKIFNNSGAINQIYTQNPDGKQLTTNLVSPTEKSLPLFLQPAAKPQNLVLHAYRLATLWKIKELYLEDLQTGEITNLLENPEYRFSTQPDDPVRRFILHLEKPSASIEHQARQNLNIYSSGHTLHIQGLNESDLGQNILVLDMQGRTLMNEKVKQIPQATLQLPYTAGTYLVKVTGDRANSIQKIIIK